MPSNTKAQGQSFDNPLLVNGVMRAKGKEGKPVWIANRTAGLGGGMNPIYVVNELPDPDNCETGTYFVISD